MSGRDSVETIRADLASGRAVRRLIMTDEAWYASAVMPYRGDAVRDWSVGVDALTEDGHDDGTYGEWCLRWYNLGHGHRSVPALRVEAFDDSWLAMAAVEGYWDAMMLAASGGATPEAVLAALIGIGFQDRTERVDPGGVLMAAPTEPTVPADDDPEHGRSAH